MSRGLGAAALLLAGLTLTAAEPRLTLRIPAFPGSEFPNFASVVLPPGGYDRLDILLEGALAQVQPSSVRVTMNGMPMTPFVSVNPMPAGVRVVVRLGLSLSPDYSIRPEGETVLAFTATDEAGMTYRAQFYLAVSPAALVPEAARSTKARGLEPAVQPPLQTRVPDIRITSAWPPRTTERTLQLDAEVRDAEGLRRIVVEVNGRDVEEVLLQNERPVRRHKGRVARGKLPGDVTGNGREVRIAVPVRLDSNRINVVALRAENVLGLSSRADRTVEVPPK
jgi:hypothetical protein